MHRGTSKFLQMSAQERIGKTGLDQLHITIVYATQPARDGLRIVLNKNSLQQDMAPSNARYSCA
eukprot:3245742-Pleurochrysis_carterae.AAC.2